MNLLTPQNCIAVVWGCYGRIFSSCAIYLLFTASFVNAQHGLVAVPSHATVNTSAMHAAARQQSVALEGKGGKANSSTSQTDDRVGPQFTIGFSTLTISGVPGLVTSFNTTPTPTSSQINSQASFVATFTTTFGSPTDARITFYADGVMIAGCVELRAASALLGDKKARRRLAIHPHFCLVFG